MDIITQNMRFRQSLIKYAEKNGVAKASRKYNKSRSYIYFWLKRWDGSIESLAEQSKKPHSHPKQHTEEELWKIRNYRRRNPELGLTELWHRLRKNGYTRRPESLYIDKLTLYCLLLTADYSPYYAACTNSTLKNIIFYKKSKIILKL